MRIALQPCNLRAKTYVQSFFRTHASKFEHFMFENSSEGDQFLNAK